MDRANAEWDPIAGWAVPFTNLHNVLVFYCFMQNYGIIKADIGKQVEV